MITDVDRLRHDVIGHTTVISDDWIVDYRVLCTRYLVLCGAVEK
jgi:hypothetical protein